METIRIAYWKTPSHFAINSGDRQSVQPPEWETSKMSESFPLPTKPEDIIPSLVDRFNSGDVRNQMAMYAPDAVFIHPDGRTITDHAEIAAIIGRDITLGLELKTNVRHIFVASDTAQIVVDWWIEGTGPDGEQVKLGGSACDIARRGADGFWRYLIDNNQGTAMRQPA